ncbi:hypothetical protein AAC387_Pa07g1566 [Persea americana]
MGFQGVLEVYLCGELFNFHLCLHHSYSTVLHNKAGEFPMKRRGVGIKQVYDAHALRVVIGDKNGKLHGPAVKCCYNLLNIVRRGIYLMRYINTS